MTVCLYVCAQEECDVDLESPMITCNRGVDFAGNRETKRIPSIFREEELRGNAVQTRDFCECAAEIKSEKPLISAIANGSLQPLSPICSFKSLR
jgi:hypothetical protein